MYFLLPQFGSFGSNPKLKCWSLSPRPTAVFNKPSAFFLKLSLPLKNSVAKSTWKYPWKSHFGERSNGFEDGHECSDINQDGLCLLDFWVSNQLAIVNTFFKKNATRLITYSSEGCHAQIDYLLVRKSQLKNIKDINVICNEECITSTSYLIVM